MTSLSRIATVAPRSRSLTAVALVALLVVGISVLRFVLATSRTPRYLPDEYLYGELARSLAQDGVPRVLGMSIGFPALVEPLVLAPLWSIGSATHAIALTHALHVAFMALAAAPVYSLAKTVRLDDRAALLCASTTLIAPSMHFASLVTADSLGYLVALVAVLAAVRALETPSVKGQAVFLGAALLATGTRIQYGVLIPAYVFGAWVVERRPAVALRRHALVNATAALSVLALLGGSQVLGRYRAASSFRLSGAAVDWLGSGTFLLFASTGVVLLPAACVWAVRSLVVDQTRERRGLAAVGFGSLVAILATASVLTVETVSDRFLERYLIIATPLAAIGFAAWWDEHRPGRKAVALIGAVLVVLAPRIPFASFTGGQGVSDSPLLMAIKGLEEGIDAGTASLIAAISLSATAVVVVLTAAIRRAPGWPTVVSAGVLLIATSVGAAHWDRGASQRVDEVIFAGNRTWIEDAGVRDALLVQTPESLRFDAMITAIMNSSIVRAAALGDNLIDGFDGLDPTPLSVADDGRLLHGGEPVRRAVVWATGGTAVAFDDANLVRYDRRFALAVPRRDVRVAMMATGIRFDGKVSPRGTIIVFPTHDAKCTRMRLELRLPNGLPPTTFRLTTKGRSHTIRVGSARATTVTVTATRNAPERLTFRATRLGQNRPGPFTDTVANARYTAGPIACTALGARP